MVAFSEGLEGAFPILLQGESILMNVFFELLFGISTRIWLVPQVWEVYVWHYKLVNAPLLRT